MKLCVVSPFPPEISGVGMYGWHVVNGLARNPQVEALTILTGSARPETHGPAFEMSALRRRYAWARNDPTLAMRLTHAIWSERPEVVWFNLGFSVFGTARVANFMGLSVPMLIQRSGLPAIVTLHEVFEAAHLHHLGVADSRLTQWSAQLATRLLLQANTVCVTLRCYAQILQDRYQARNVQHVPLGTFAPPELLPRPAAPHNILILATYAPYKGLPVLLEAFGRVRQACPAATLTVAGSDHPRFPGYLASVRAATNGAAGIHWLGAQTEGQLRELFMQAHVVVIPSLATTGASSVLHRAAAFGRPLVASNLPDLRAVADEENLALDYVPPGDAAALAEALLRCLADPERQAAAARHNLARMQTMTLDQTCSRYVELFNQAIRRGQTRALLDHA